MLRKPLMGATLAALLVSLVSLVSCNSDASTDSSALKRLNSLLSPATSAEDSGAIILTDVDFDPDSLIPETQPVADYLAKNLQRAGISQGKVNIAPDVETVAQWMRLGEANLYFDSVYPVMTVMDSAGGTPILRRWKDGVAEYSTYFVVRRDRNIKTLADLQGQMMTLQEPSSSSGFMFPMAYLLDLGLNPIEKAEVNHAVADNEIGYVFSGQEDVSVEWILAGKVVAGVVDSETWSELPTATQDQLKIVAQTDKFPRHVVLAGSTLNAEQIAALKATLLDMEDSKQGREALTMFSETTQFDEFPEGGEATIARLQNNYDKIQRHLAQQK
jgi:phosphonate transport system substrate-binding protein